MKIVKIPHPVLNTITTPVAVFDDKLRKTIEDMTSTLTAQKDPEGVGLAAPQVGIGQSFFIMKIGKEPVEAFINPRIVTEEKDKKSVKPNEDDEAKLEGCLSIPRIWAPVPRSKRVLLEYQNEQGELQQKWFSKLKSIVVQHEVDHLQGVLFTQRVVEQNLPLYEEHGDKLERIRSI